MTEPALPAPRDESYELPQEDFADLYLGIEERNEVWLGAYRDGPCESYALGYATFACQTSGGPGQIVRLTAADRAATLERVRRMVVRLQELPATPDQPKRYRQILLDRAGVKLLPVVAADGSVTTKLLPSYKRAARDYPLACHLWCVPADKRYTFAGGLPPRLLPFPPAVAEIVAELHRVREAALAGALRTRARGPALAR